MEHHPYWHVASDDLDVEAIHVHEAIHGWFGNGVRLRCWEDFVVSEGTTSYLTVRVLTEVAGEEVGTRLWSEYRGRLLRAQERCSQRIAWPSGCGLADVERDLFTGITYMKGAFFLRAVSLRTGEEALDRALAAFYAEHVGGAAGMEELLEAIRRHTGFDPSACAAAWLRREELPPWGPCPGAREGG
jgi:aminopeptidase N